ncbi:MAG: GNAT family N-acetyltransferase [Gammaproteobacteria bacterium]|nr:GNAT family N-acetyltransferase [Gammaproteobacteria bacterium]
MNEIVKLGADRAPEIARLNKLLIQDERHANRMSESELEARMQNWLTSVYQSYGVVSDGQIICYSLWRDDGDYYYMRQLFTLREFRRQGLARELLSFLEKNVYSDKPIRLEVLAGNAEAQSFYRSVGYQLYCQTMLKDPTS